MADEDDKGDDNDDNDNAITRLGVTSVVVNPELKEKEFDFDCEMRRNTFNAERSQKEARFKADQELASRRWAHHEERTRHERVNEWVWMAALMIIAVALSVTGLLVVDPSKSTWALSTAAGAIGAVIGRFSHRSKGDGPPSPSLPAAAPPTDV